MNLFILLLAVLWLTQRAFVFVRFGCAVLNSDELKLKPSRCGCTAKEQVPALFCVRGQDCTETIALDWKMALWGYMCMFDVLHYGIYLRPLACTVSSAFERSHFEPVYACGQSLPLFSLLHSFLRVVKALLLKWTGLQGHMKLEPTKFCTSC